MERRSALLLHPVFLLSLGTLLLNDHYLKHAHASWLTGKLSDFSGLLVLSFVAVWFLERWFPSRRSIAAIHLACGAAFAIWKLLPIEVWVSELLSMFSLPGLTKTHDATDLFALAILLLSYRLFTAEVSHTQVISSFARRFSAATALVISMFAIMATSIAPSRYTLSVPESAPVTESVGQTLWRIEKSLADAGVNVERRHRDKSGSYILSYHISDSVGQNLSDARGAWGSIYVTLDQNLMTCTIDSIAIAHRLRHVRSDAEPFLESVCRELVLGATRRGMAQP